MAYNDGGPCELEAYVEDYQQEMTGAHPVA
jgi:hypothetical protein